MVADPRQFKRPNLHEIAHTLLRDIKLPTELAAACLPHTASPEQIETLRSWDGFADYVIDELDKLSESSTLKRAPFPKLGETLTSVAEHIMAVEKSLHILEDHHRLRQSGLTAVQENLPHDSSSGLYAETAQLLEKIAGWERYHVGEIKDRLESSEDRSLFEIQLRQKSPKGGSAEELPELDEGRSPNLAIAIYNEEIPHIKALATGLRYFQSQFAQLVSATLKPPRSKPDVPTAAP